MRLFLVLGLVALVGACSNYGTPAGHWPPDVVVDAGSPGDSGPVAQTDGGSGGQQDAAVPVVDSGTPVVDSGAPCDAGKPKDCDGDEDSCVKKCKKDHDDRDDSCDRDHRQCQSSCKNDDDRKKCDKDRDDRQHQCGQQDGQCVLKCKKDKDDCDKEEGR